MSAPAVQAAGPLAQLRDIHLPAAVGWWPPAPGWWVLGAALLAGLTAAGLWLWRRRQRRRYRRLALREARIIYRRWQLHDDNVGYLRAINRLLKQCALNAYPQRQVAALSGADWLCFLDRGLRRPRFTEPGLRALAEVYRPQPATIAPEQLQPAVEHWIRRHRC